MLRFTPEQKASWEKQVEDQTDDIIINEVKIEKDKQFTFSVWLKLKYIEMNQVNDDEEFDAAMRAEWDAMMLNRLNDLRARHKILELQIQRHLQMGNDGLIEVINTYEPVIKDTAVTRSFYSNGYDSDFALFGNDSQLKEEEPLI
jgi:hypothetical protein